MPSRRPSLNAFERCPQSQVATYIGQARNYLRGSHSLETIFQPLAVLLETHGRKRGELEIGNRLPGAPPPLRDGSCKYNYYANQCFTALGREVDFSGPVRTLKSTSYGLRDYE